MKPLLVSVLLCLGINAFAKAPNILFILADEQSWSGTSVRMKGGHPFYLQPSYYAVHQKPQALAATLKKYEGLSGDGCHGGRPRHLHRRGFEEGR